MALDVQSNWNVEMTKAPDFRNSKRYRAQNDNGEKLDGPTWSKHPPREINLPLEIISQIISYIPRRQNTQSTLWACALVSRGWYSASISLLYERPYLDGGNFNEFVTTVCPSKNAHIRRSALAVMVKRLDMGELVHNSSKSLTARLLGRLKGNIEQFVAPQSSFAINSFAALSKCTKLRYLDLSLISASISNKLLFQTLKNLPDLEVLFFPRSSSHDVEREEVAYSWPPKLQALHLAGGIDDSFLEKHLVNLPTTLCKMSIQHCTNVHLDPLLSTLAILGPRLQHLTIRHPMPQLSIGSLNSIFLLCPLLIALCISADYIDDGLFEMIPSDHPLRILDFDCSGTAGPNVEVKSESVREAVDQGKLSSLRSVRVSKALGWTSRNEAKINVLLLSETLEEEEDLNPLDIQTGVWIY